MTAPRYLTVVELKNYIQSKLTLVDTLYTEAINTAEMMIDNALQRRMEVAGVTPTARLFTVRRSSPVLYIHDCTTITAVTENGTTLTSGSDYQAEPLNGLSDAGEAWPFYRLVKPYSYWYPITNTVSTTARVSVTGTWGWAAIPPQVKESCKIIAKDVFNERDSGGFGLVAITDAGGVGTRENWIVRKMIKNYSHPSTIGIV